MNTRTMRVLVDTNVWLDQFLPERPHGQESREFLDRAVESNLALAYPAGSLKDVFYLVDNESKRMARRETGALTQEDAQAAQEYAWGCIEAVQDLASPVPVDLIDIRKASIWRRSNGDFEDNLVRAAAERLEADLVVTWDRGLLSKCFVPTVTPPVAVCAMEAWDEMP